MLRKIFGKCICNNCEADSDQLEEQQYSNRNGRRIQHSTTETTLMSVAGASSFQQSSTCIKRSTPVLFSTNRGLYLRVAKILPPNSVENTNDDSDNNSALYDISFCDLERWSTNRAHTINLEDTFTIARRNLEPVEEHPSPTSGVDFPNCSTCSSKYSDKNSFMPITRSSRLNNIYSRFDTGQYPQWRY